MPFLTMDGPGGVPYTKLFDYDGGANVVYEGWARSERNPNANKDKAIWFIKKYTYDVAGNVTLIQTALGNTNESHIWDNRAALTYK